MESKGLFISWIAWIIAVVVLIVIAYNANPYPEDRRIYKSCQIAELQQDSIASDLDFDSLKELFALPLVKGKSEGFKDFGFSSIDGYGNWSVAHNEEKVFGLTCLWRKWGAGVGIYTGGMADPALHAVSWGDIHVRLTGYHPQINRTDAWIGYTFCGLTLVFGVLYWGGRRQLYRSRRMLFMAIVGLMVLIVSIFSLGLLFPDYKDNRYYMESPDRVIREIAESNIDWNRFLAKVERSGIVATPRELVDYPTYLDKTVFVGKAATFPVEFIRFNLDMYTYLYYIGDGDIDTFKALNRIVDYTDCGGGFYLLEYTKFKGLYKYKIYESGVLLFTILLGAVLWLVILKDIIFGATGDAKVTNKIEPLKKSLPNRDCI